MTGRHFKKFLGLGILPALFLGQAEFSLAQQKMKSSEASKQANLRKKVVRAPAGADKKPLIIHRRNMKPERQFQFDENGLIIPSEPAAFTPVPPRSSSGEVQVQVAPLIAPQVGTGPTLKKTASLPKIAAGLSPMPEFKMKNPGEMKASTETYTPEELQLFDAFVHLEDRKAYLPALGAFAPLMAKPSNLQTTARWGYAHAALGLGLRLQYELTLLDFLNNNDQKWAKRAFDSLVTNSDLEKSVWVQHLSDEQFDRPFTEKSTDPYLMMRAHRLVAQGRVKDAIENLSRIPLESRLYGWRMYHEALLTYRQGKSRDAQDLLQQALSLRPQAFSANELKAKSQMLLGRLSFQNRDFNRAFESYRSVPQNNPIWPEAMMEQALSQILFEDFEGAAGNMFSLHTDFFKKSYSPDSYLIRSVGYLNLCQYADALKVTEDLQRKYKPILAALEKYAQSSPTPEKDFEMIREFAKNPNVREIRGLARAFLFAWTQDPDFERHQSRINQVEDEMESFRNLSLQIVKQERGLSQRLAQASGAVRDATLAKADDKKVQSLTANLEALRSETRLLQTARKSLAQLRPEMNAKLEVLKSERKEMALKALSQRRQQLQAGLQGVLDQSDVLMYEIYNGAGDHLRFQAAGGEIEARRTAALNAKGQASVNWKYKGEIWEDELGHFRSSLSNVCAKELSARTDSTKEGDL